MELEIQRTSEGVAFWIHVTPRAKRESVGGVHGDALKVVTKAPPVEGQANASCVQLLAKALGIQRQAVDLDPGARGRRKRVKIQGEPSELENRLRKLASARQIG